jgi:hypothetical protein
MKTAVEFLVNQLPLGVKGAILDKIEQAKEMEKEQSELYAEFAVLNDRSGNPIIPFNEFINIENL